MNWARTLNVICDRHWLHSRSKSNYHTITTTTTRNSKERWYMLQCNVFSIQIFWIWACLMKAIPETCRVHGLTACLMKAIPDTCRVHGLTACLMKAIPETCRVHRLTACLMKAILDTCCAHGLTACLMKAIPETRRVHPILYLRIYCTRLWKEKINTLAIFELVYHD
jgi:hypothetical protein